MVVIGLSQSATKQSIQGHQMVRLEGFTELKANDMTMILMI